MFSPPSQPRFAFTLIELLIVVAIIAILAAIAVPNFLEAQTRAKVSRAMADMRSIATGVESFRIDTNKYPIGSDDPTKVPPEAVATVTQLAGGFDYYTFSTQNNEWNGTTFSHVGEVIGGAYWPGLTTPIAYFTTAPLDPFIAGGAVTFSYRESRDGNAGSQWILTSVGPDVDLKNNWRGAPSDKIEDAPDNPFTGSVGAAFDAIAAERTPKEGRHGDISERAIEVDTDGYSLGDLEQALALISYDPTNGTVSDGDLWRLGPGSGSSSR